VGWIGGVNIASARILDARSEMEVRAELASVVGVQNVALNYVLFDRTISGTRPPLQSVEPSEVLSAAELVTNWHHYVMGTFPAHALADAVLKRRGDLPDGFNSSDIPVGAALSDVILAVVDQGSFQSQHDAGDPDRSLLDPNTTDSDLAPRLVHPTGIIRRDLGPVMPDSRPGTFVVGPPDLQSNPILAAPNTSVHGLLVASAAVGGGQDLIGTGRHVRFMPVRLVQDVPFWGRCATDLSVPCRFEDPMGPCAVDCIPGTPMDSVLASLALLANNLESELGRIEAANVKVINLSTGASVDGGNVAEVRNLFQPILDKLISGDRIVVLAADNSPVDAQTDAPAFMAPTRGTRQSAGSDRGMMLVAGTKLPDFNVAQRRLEFDGRDEAAWPESAFGENVSVSAPAQDVPVLDTSFQSKSLLEGNSFAAPSVAGIAAELFVVDPTATNLDVVQAIESTADTIFGNANQIGHGRVNFWKAMLTLLNRSDPENPEWVGVRFRFGGAISPKARVFLNCHEAVGGSNPPCQEVPDVHWHRVPDESATLNSNAREVPSASVQPAALSAAFSFSTDELDDLPGRIGLIDIRESGGQVVYQMPWRLSDLINDVDAFPIDTSVDDYVVTFDPKREVASLFGRVTDESGQPVSGALVHYVSDLFQSSTAATDNDGYYVIYDAAPNETIDLRTSLPGTVTDTVAVTIDGFHTRRQDFSLAPAIHGTVRNATSGAVVVGATVELLDAGGQSIDQLTSSADGTFVFTPVAAGTYSIRVSAIGFTTQTIPITVGAGELVEISIELDPELGDGGFIFALVEVHELTITSCSINPNADVTVTDRVDRRRGVFEAGDPLFQIALENLLAFGARKQEAEGAGWMSAEGRDCPVYTNVLEVTITQIGGLTLEEANQMLRDVDAMPVESEQRAVPGCEILNSC
jgi:hypothetical protein